MHKRIRYKKKKTGQTTYSSTGLKSKAGIIMKDKYSKKGTNISENSSITKKDNQQYPKIWNDQTLKSEVKSALEIFNMIKAVWQNWIVIEKSTTLDNIDIDKITDIEIKYKTMVIYMI